MKIFELSILLQVNVVKQANIILHDYPLVLAKFIVNLQAD